MRALYTSQRTHLTWARAGPEFLKSLKALKHHYRAIFTTFTTRQAQLSIAEDKLREVLTAGEETYRTITDELQGLRRDLNDANMRESNLQYSLQQVMNRYLNKTQKKTL